MSKTLFDKIWDSHIVKSMPGGRSIIYIDRHFIHEVTSPQAFAGLDDRGIKVFRKKQTIATADHNVPTKDQHLEISEPLSKKQVDTLTSNCKNHNIELYGLGSEHQGIVHVIGPELGITRPGMTIVCGDSHTSTHGAFGTVAFGIGTSQVEQVFASQCLILDRPKTMRITVNGELQKGVSAKDVILYIIAKLGVGGGTGHFIEYAGSTFRSMSMESRMTICNMSIEMGARGGLIAPDDITIDYIRDRKFAPKNKDFISACAYWSTLNTDAYAQFDTEHSFQAEDITPFITYGTNPGMGIQIEDIIPADEPNQKALEYMGFSSGESLIGKKIQHVFIGSCTNSRIEDLREVAEFLK
jgi:3-isopropylmalate/(R)-2-methylmalate dehydratase large subunit